MALYEVVLCFPDRAEVRFTDRPMAVGEIFQISYVDWQVVLQREPEDARAAARFLCELTREQRSQARKLRSDAAEPRDPRPAGAAG